MSHFSDIGADVEVAAPDLGDAEWVFQTLRGAQFAAGMSGLLRENRSQLKDEIIWNTEHGLSLSSEEIGRAEVERGGIINRTARFFEEYDVLVCPTVVSPPFDVDIRYLTEIDGHNLPDIHKLADTHIRADTDRLPGHIRPVRVHQVRPTRRNPDHGPLERRGLPTRRSRPVRAGRWT